MMWFKDICWGIKKDKSGYTLVELISVLALIGLVLALAWPGYATMADKAALKQDATVLVRELRLARQNAITLGRECVVSFVASSGTSCSTTYELRQNGQSRIVRLNRGGWVVGTTFGADPKYPLQTNRTACRFYPSGIPARGGTIHLKSARGNSLYVAVTPVTARVRVTEADPRI